MSVILCSYLARNRPGLLDHDLVAQYLRLKRPEDVARLAASLAPRAKKFDPAQLAEQALALKIAADLAFVEQQEQLLAKMNANTLFELHRMLHGTNAWDWMANDHPERLRDPISAQLAYHLRVVWGKIPGLADREAKQAEVVLKAADERVTKLHRPMLPCDLETAIRYATNEPNAPWSALKTGFIEFLGYSSIRDAITRDSMLAGMPTVVLLKPAKQPLDKEILPGETLTADDLQLPKENRDAVPSSEQRSIDMQDYLDRFKPRQDVPDYIGSWAKEEFDTQWAPGVKYEFRLAKLAKDFYDFWQLHGEHYIKSDPETVKRAKRIKPAKQRGADSSLLARQRTKFPDLTNACLSFISRLERFPNDPAAWRLAVDQFTQQNPSELPPQTAVTTAQDFLGSLWNAASSPKKALEIITTLLSRKGFKNLEEDVVRKCLALLAEAKRRAAE